jgi:MinD superfamily P-loop ATPase
MKDIVVISGKGGTGKTTIVASLAALAKSKVMVDCDVDAADLDLLLHPITKKNQEFWSGQKAVIDQEKCTQCGLCEDICRFNAIKEFQVNAVYCEGCGFCYHICPDEAVIMEQNLAGSWSVSETRYGPLVHARLGVAQENSGKLVATVRKHAKTIAEEQGLDLILSDGPPGIGCPVISSISGVNLAVVVTEPTLSGIYDLERVIGVCHHFGVPVIVCINKYDLNEDNTRQIEGYCNDQLIDIAVEIPYDNVVTEALVRGLPVVEYADNGISHQIKVLWEAISTRLINE